MLVPNPFATWSALTFFFSSIKLRACWLCRHISPSAWRTAFSLLQECFRNDGTLLNDMLPHQKFCNIQQRISTSIMFFLRPTSLTHSTCLRCWHFRLLNKLASTFYRKQNLIFSRSQDHIPSQLNAVLICSFKKKCKRILPCRRMFRKWAVFHVSRLKLWM